MTIQAVRLSDVCEISMGQAPSGDSYNSEGAGLPLLAGAGDLGDLTPSPKKFTTEAAKTSRKGDIILCIRATIGDRNWSDAEYCLGRGVAGLRADSSRLDQTFLWHWLGSITPVLRSKGRGATFLQVSKADIASLPIRLPSLAEQRRIAAILDKADAIRANRREAIAKLDQLLKSVFLDMFGDPVTNPKKWPVGPLSSLGTLDRGVSKHRPRGAPELLGGAHPLIQTGDVARCHRYIREYSSTYSDVGLAQSKKWRAGTMCITIAANIASTGILTFDACFPDSVVGFTANDSSAVEYVQTMFTFLRQGLDERASQVAQKNINLEVLRELQVPLPPTASLRDWKAKSDAFEQLRSQMVESSVCAEKFGQSLASQFFGSGC